MPLWVVSECCKFTPMVFASLQPDRRVPRPTQSQVSEAKDQNRARTQSDAQRQRTLSDAHYERYAVPQLLVDPWSGLDPTPLRGLKFTLFSRSSETNNLRIMEMRSCIPPAVLCEDCPCSDCILDTVVRGRKSVQDILHGQDDRLVSSAPPYFPRPALSIDFFFPEIFS